MFIRSTGLGRTLLTGRVAAITATTVIPATLEAPGDGATEPRRLLVEIEITHPVHWTVRAFVDPPDLRAMVKIILTSPRLIFQCLAFLFRKGPQPDEPGLMEQPAAAVPAAPLKGAPGPAPKGPGAIPARRR